ncbi:kyphoscoliosis peptidase [Plakobranchus ocellatus]|uniref:Kyphoscoliosis peptidase n=1 Tax=Plakobranchus ocellatus TaxID=259542 RepID=A0AAV4DKY6_9GAST|nr:kyphoscoliosis peptidase [Plakobranchus ocellatus]
MCVVLAFLCGKNHNCREKCMNLNLEVSGCWSTLTTVTFGNHVTSSGLDTQVVTKFVKCAGEKELPEYVFTQRKDDEEVRFAIAFPEDGWYKFQIFALPEEDPAESLPNVYNYLIEVTGNFRPAVPFVKTYTKFYKDCCYLEEPLYIDPNNCDLDDVKFKVTVPGAIKVAVHAVDEWFHLEKKGSKWEGEAALARFKTTGAKITLNANYEKDSSSYSVLLEYNI